MRFQINKVSFHKKYRLTKPVIEAYYKRWPAEYYDTEMFSYAAYTAGICSYCKAELYGLWHIRGIGNYKENASRTKEEVRLQNEDYDAMYKKWADLDNAQANEREAFEEAKDILCPVCKKGHYTYIDYGFSDEFQGDITDEMVDELLNPVYEKYYAKLGVSPYKDSQVYAEEAAKNFCDSCDIPIVSTGKTKSLDIEELKEYVHNLVQLESNIISLKKRLVSLYYESDKNRLTLMHADYRPYQNLQKKIEAAEVEYFEFNQVYKEQLRLLELRKSEGPRTVLPPKPEKPTEPEYKKANFFNKSKVLQENALLEKQYKKDLQIYDEEYRVWLSEVEALTLAAQERYHAEILALEESVQKSKERLEELRAISECSVPDAPDEICSEKALKKMLEEEIAKTEEILKTTYNVRNEMYGANVIFSKYHNIVALATFYEYLISGRCVQLEGHDGAYNLYEAESRANIIISKLSDIEKSLNSIEESQYMIYSKLTDMNNTLSRLDRTMDAAYSAISAIEINTNNMSNYMNKIAQNTDVIAHNTAVTAYYSKINAELTNALGFMVALK